MIVVIRKVLPATTTKKWKGFFHSDNNLHNHGQSKLHSVSQVINLSTNLNITLTKEGVHIKPKITFE